MKKLFYLFCFALLLSCRHEPPSFEGTWLGAAREVDKELYASLPYLLVAKSDGMYNAYPIEYPDSEWKSWEYKNKILRLDTNKYIFPEFEISENEFVLNKAYKTFFRKLTTPNNLNNEILQTLLQNTYWKSDEDFLWFKDSSELRIKKTTSEFSEKLCWSILTDQEFTFLIKKGNHLDCEGNYRFIEVIQTINDTSFTIERWQDGKWRSIHYQKTNQSDFPLTLFQLCNPYLFRSNARHRYYYQNTFYKGGIYKINKLLNSYYTPPENSTESGLIKIEFIVNCQGVPGNFSILELNNNYELKTFPKEISVQLLEFTKTLTNWNAGVSPTNNQAVDTYRFLTYKIKNGKVVEIFP